MRKNGVAREKKASNVDSVAAVGRRVDGHLGSWRFSAELSTRTTKFEMQQQHKIAMQSHKGRCQPLEIARLRPIRQDRREVRAMASENLSAGDAFTDLLVERLGLRPSWVSGTMRCERTSVADAWLDDGARRCSGAGGVVSGTVQCVDAASGP